MEKSDIAFGMYCADVLAFFEDLPGKVTWRKRKEGTMPGIFEDIVGRDAWRKNSSRKQLYGNVRQSNGVC